MAAVHDPTAKQAHGNAQGLTTQQKIDGLHEITKQVTTAMLTSRSPDGKLASRAMIPATTEGLGEHQLCATECQHTLDTDTF